ncbi:MAG: LLM class flavin-dependent oxidoreductase [Gemmatimonadaceae bacterium]|nr:LLM class flavin-dependent oxidoreductase [Gemmatimonadaceae bacterium]
MPGRRRQLPGSLVRDFGRAYGARLRAGPSPPLVLAAHGPRTLALAARFADTWNTYGPTLGEAIEQSSGRNRAATVQTR